MICRWTNKDNNSIDMMNTILYVFAFVFSPVKHYSSSFLQGFYVCDFCVKSCVNVMYGDNVYCCL